MRDTWEMIFKITVPQVCKASYTPANGSSNWKVFTLLMCEEGWHRSKTEKIHDLGSRMCDAE